jgi:hypothetical protein
VEGSIWDAIGLSSGSLDWAERLGLLLILVASVGWMWWTGEKE